METAHILVLSRGSYSDYQEDNLAVFQREDDAENNLHKIRDTLGNIEKHYEHWAMNNKELSHKDRWEYNHRKEAELKRIIEDSGIPDIVSKQEVFNIIHFNMEYSLFILKLPYMRGA